MKKRRKFHIQPLYIVFILTIVCFAMMILSTAIPGFTSPFKNAVSVVVVPLEKSVNHIGMWLTDKTDNLTTIDQLNDENQKLKEQIEELQEDNNLLAQNKSELDRLRDLYELDGEYTQYKKTAARVIGRDTGNYFNIFTIDKGSEDGIKKYMNVIAGGGLVGIVFDVGKNYAKVRSIIDDESSVSVAFSNGSDTAIVSGDLELIEKGYMNITGIMKDATVTEGDMVVTSQISDKYLPGILVGYVQSVKQDANELTQSGTITPVVDFQHISEVLVILQVKETPENED